LPATSSPSQSSASSFSNTPAPHTPIAPHYSRARPVGRRRAASARSYHHRIDAPARRADQHRCSECSALATNGSREASMAGMDFPTDHRDWRAPAWSPTMPWAASSPSMVAHSKARRGMSSTSHRTR
jgi:hypothetical protein